MYVTMTRERLSILSTNKHNQVISPTRRQTLGRLHKLALILVLLPWDYRRDRLILNYRLNNLIRIDNNLDLEEVVLEIHALDPCNIPIDRHLVYRKG